MCLAIAVLALIESAASRSQADTPSASRLIYDVPDACPSESVFRKQVASRTTRVTFGDSPSPGTDEVRVRIRETQSSFEGEISVVRASGAASERVIEDASCPALVEAAALIVALAFDPKARLDPVSDGSPEEPPVDPPAPPPPEPLPPEEPKPVLAPQPETQPVPWFWAAGLGLRMRSGIADTWRPDASLFVATGAPEAGSWSPSFRLTGYRTTSGEIEVAAGSAHMTYAGGAVELCSSRWRADSLSLEAPCLGVEAGWVWAKGNIDVPREQDDFWLAGQGTARVQWRPGWLLLEAQATLGVLPWEYRFHFSEPNVTVHEVPLVYGLLGVGAGATF